MKINTIPVDILKVDCDSAEEFVEEAYKAFLKSDGDPIKWDIGKSLKLGLLFLNLNDHAGSLILIRIADVRVSSNKETFLKILRGGDDAKKYFLDRAIEDPTLKE